MRANGLSLAFILLALALVPAGIAGLRGQDVSLAGEWELVAETQKGGVNWTAAYAVTGEDLEVTMTGPRGNTVKGLGTLKGDAIEWTIKVTTPRGTMDILYKGTVAGDAMSGEVTRGNLGTSAWSAKRKPAA
jgi:hypothetical protein